MICVAYADAARRALPARTITTTMTTIISLNMGMTIIMSMNTATTMVIITPMVLYQIKARPGR